MKKVAVLGHFAFGTTNNNGQTIKTKVVAEELRRALGDEEVSLADTAGGWRFLMRMPFVLNQLLANHRNIVILPAYKGVLTIVPLLVLLNAFYHRSIHYVVIGGWLMEHIRKYRLLKRMLQRLYRIYPETQMMKVDLWKAGLDNVQVMPNCKALPIVSKAEYDIKQIPLRLCTFSRVIKEKGIEDAAEAVRRCNEELGRIAFSLDIYGKVEEREWFDTLMSNQPQYIRYAGMVPFDRSVDVLKDYFALLFPTYYKGECFAGTLIDAFAAGLPIIASDWHQNAEIVTENRTGMFFPTRDVEALKEILVHLADHPMELVPMRKECAREAQRYQPDVVLKTLTDNLQ